MTNCGGLHVDAPGWEDQTEELALKCYTLARPDGVGAFQVSTGLYRSGPLPWPALMDLLSMARDQVTADHLEPFDEATGMGPSVLWGAVSFVDGEFRKRLWVLSNGIDFALVTYTCATTDWPGELSEAEEMARGARFEVQAQAA